MKNINNQNIDDLFTSIEKETHLFDTNSNNNSNSNININFLTQSVASNMSPFLPSQDDHNNNNEDNSYEDDDEDEYEEEKNTISEYSFSQSDPKNDSSMCSRFFFYWGYRIIKLARLTRLSLEHLGELTQSNSSFEYSRQISSIWEHYKNKPNALFKTVFHANILGLLFIVVFSLIHSVSTLYVASLFNQFINNYTQRITQGNEHEELAKIRNLVVLALQYLLIKLLMIFMHRKLIEYQNEVGYKAGFQLDCLIFNKILHSSLTRDDHATIADIVNYIQVDSYKLTTTIIASPNVITIPFLIIGYSFLLFRYFGRSFLIGFATLIIFVFINFYIQKDIKNTQNLHHQHKDETMKTIIDTFNHIKAIKVNGWEEEFLTKIQMAKEKEIESMRIRGLYSNINQTCLWFAPVVISTVTIGLGEYYKGSLKVGDVFTCLKIFGDITTPIRGLPSMLSNFFFTFVSLKRIANYLYQKEYDESYVIRDNIETADRGVMIKIDNGNFTWGKTVNIDARKDSAVLIDSRRNSSFSSSINVKDVDTNVHDVNIINTNSNYVASHEGPIGFEVIDYVKEAPVIKNINLTIYNSEFICVLGDTGSGKTSLLESILNNMYKTTDDSVIYVNGSISYVSQVPWISNDTVKNNITFHYDYNEQRYKEVIKICRLDKDIESLIGGDSTEIGENGINISGGQKSRISLARGLYADKDIYIFDEPTSAIDARVALSIIKKGLSEFLNGKTRILVTQTIEYAAFAERVLYMKDGVIIWEGSFEELQSQPFAKQYNLQGVVNGVNINNKRKRQLRGNVLGDYGGDSSNYFVNTNANDNDELPLLLRNSGGSSDDIINTSLSGYGAMLLNTSDDNIGSIFDNSSSDNIMSTSFEETQQQQQPQEQVIRTTLDEELLQGSIHSSIITKALTYLGGKKLLALLALFVVQWQLSVNGSAFWMFYWGEHQAEEYNLEYFIVYASFGIAGAILTFLKNRMISASLGTTSKNLHLDMVYHLVRAPLNSFHDITPKGQIINRLSRDINTVEDYFYQTYSSLVAFATAFVYGIAMCSVYQPFCLILIPMLGIIGVLLSKFYFNCSRDLVRLEGIARSPVLNIVNETCLGSNTIRSHKYNEKYNHMFYKRINELFKVRLCIIGTFQWYSLMLDLLSFFFELFLVVFSLSFMQYYNDNLEVIALLLNYSTSLETTLSSFLLDSSSFQNTMISMERCLKYSDIVKEAPSRTTKDKELTHWPYEGSIVFHKYSTRYRPTTKIKLHKLSLEIKPREKVGIVGRSGSGKSTIVLSLVRTVEGCGGKITIDNVDIRQVGLKKLRNSLNVISQDLSLLEGTLRYNIDPLGEHSDKEIKRAMKRLNFSYIYEQSELGLDRKVTEGGMNFSMSEKQLIYATRALLNNKKIVILDEFTSNLDYKTESLVNKVLFKTFENATVIVIAHRIKTVMKCDKVLVLHNGKVAEYGNPNELKKDKTSLFYKLYQRSYLEHK